MLGCPDEAILKASAQGCPCPLLCPPEGLFEHSEPPTLAQPGGCSRPCGCLVCPCVCLLQRVSIGFFWPQRVCVCLPFCSVSTDAEETSVFNQGPENYLTVTCAKMDWKRFPLNSLRLRVEGSRLKLVQREKMPDLLLLRSRKN